MLPSPPAIEPRFVTTTDLRGKKALVTGASGFIGGHVRTALLARGADVVAIRRKGSPPSKKGRSVEAEYDDRAALDRIVRDEKPDYVFHVAGATKGVAYDNQPFAASSDGGTNRLVYFSYGIFVAETFGNIGVGRSCVQKPSYAEAQSHQRQVAASRNIPSSVTNWVYNAEPKSP